MRLSRVALVLVLVPGCYLRHGAEAAPARRPDAGSPRRDAGAPARPDAGRPPGRDAGVRLDAGPPPPGGFWRLERREPFLAVAHALGCAAMDGGRFVVRASIPFMDTCDFGGPVELEATDDGGYVVHAYVWRRYPLDPDECLGITAIAERSLAIEAVAGGRIRVESAEGTSTVHYDVLRQPPDAPPCDGSGEAGASCTRDCDCRGSLVCVPGLGDFVMCEGGRCGAPCDTQGAVAPPVFARHLDCEPSQRCEHTGALAAPTCEAIEGDGCFEAPELCAPGTVCPPTGIVSECVWDLRLTGMNRHRCGTNADCDPGLHCVEHRDGERRCEVMCMTPGMRCPPMHLCDSRRWVCEWLGE